MPAAIASFISLETGANSGGGAASGTGDAGAGAATGSGEGAGTATGDGVAFALSLTAGCAAWPHDEVAARVSRTTPTASALRTGGTVLTPNMVSPLAGQGVHIAAPTAPRVALLSPKGFDEVHAAARAVGRGQGGVVAAEGSRC